MAIQGKLKENNGKEYKKYVGLFNAKVIAVNPTKEELEKILNTTIEKDIEYISSNDENGAKRIALSFWLEDPNTQQHFNVRFNLEDTIVVSKSGKTQFINNIGTTSYAESIDNLPEWFKDGRDIRIAKKGEELLYKFLRNWISNLDYYDSSTELYLDWKKLISGIS